MITASITTKIASFIFFSNFFLTEHLMQELRNLSKNDFSSALSSNFACQAYINRKSMIHTYLKLHESNKDQKCKSNIWFWFIKRAQLRNLLDTSCEAIFRQTLMNSKTKPLILTSKFSLKIPSETKQPLIFSNLWLDEASYLARGCQDRFDKAQDWRWTVGSYLSGMGWYSKTFVDKHSTVLSC